MGKIDMRRIFLFILTICISVGVISAGAKSAEKKMSVRKPTTVEYTLFDGNQIRCYVGNTGEIVSYNVTGDAGLEWPKGSGKTAVFQSGLWVTGKVDGEIRSAAAEYTSEFQPGPILQYDPTPGIEHQPGVPANAGDARYQIYKINRGDVADPKSEKYNREYALWPVDDGAPAHDGEYFEDVNGNGVYDEGEPFEDYDLDGEYDPPDGVLVEGEDPPLILGDQMLWFVCNDMDEGRHSNLWSTKPLGIEIQSTVFGFNRADPLGNVMFIKWLLINKSGKTIEDAYISMWSDADVGDAKDDFVGCDTTLSVGYMYNGNPVDQDYGTTPPCVGYDFFQGPVVPSPGDTALVSGRLIPDYRNLPMTSFVKYTNSDPEYGDPENAIEAYNYMSGLTAQGQPWKDPEGNTTYFLYPGDPVTRQGWTEYDDSSPDDRRFLMSSGPFDLPTWEDLNGDGKPQVGEPGVQEIVGAIIIAAGTNNLNAITAMKFFDRYAQNAYDSQFDLPSPPIPKVKVSELDKQIILSWTEDAEKVENYEKLGYKFEGYNVYQGESANGPWKLIATYDKVNDVTVVLDMQLDISTGLILELPVQFGNNSGVKRMIDIRKDAIRGNIDLINGRVYYFAVTSYAYNGERAPKVVESAKVPLTVRPHEPALGAKLLTATSDTIPIVHERGIGEAEIVATVVDPLQLTGEKYSVRFGYDSTASQGYWYFGIVDSASGVMRDTIVTKSTELDSAVLPFVDGFKLKLKNITFDSPKGFMKWEQTKNIIGTRIDSVQYPAVSPGGVDTLALIDGDTVKVDTICGEGKYYDYYKVVSLPDWDYFRLFRVEKHDVMIAGTAKDVGGRNMLASSIPGVGGGITDPILLRSDIEFRFTERGQKAICWPSGKMYQPLDTLIHVPFEVWDVERNKQLCVGIGDNNNNSRMYDPEAQTLEKDWVVILFTDYETYQDSIQQLLNNPNTGWLVYFSEASRYTVGDVVRLYFLNPVRAGEDEYTFLPKGLSKDLSKAELNEQLKKINVFPNPYFAFNVEETQPIERFVTFTHLPEKNCVIRIFSLGGQLVKKIDHNKSDFAGTSFERWDLTNDYGIPVASGIYIVHVEVKGVGSKVLKLAVFIPEERLDLY